MSVRSEIQDWLNRPYWKYRKVSVGPQFTNAAMLVWGLVLLGSFAVVMWVLLGALP